MKTNSYRRRQSCDFLLYCLAMKCAVLEGNLYAKQIQSDQIIKPLLKAVFAKYRDLSVSRSNLPQLSASANN